MSQWKYKIIGALLGILTRRPQFIILGLVIGHLFDIGFFSKKAAPRIRPSRMNRRGTPMRFWMCRKTPAWTTSSRPTGGRFPTTTPIR